MTSPERVHTHAQSRDTRIDNSQRVEPGGSGARAEVNDNGSKVTAYIALIMTGVTLGMFIMYVLLTPQILDAKIAAGAADAKAEANAAKVNARVALEKVESIKNQLATKGIVITDH